jgi:hypothetical protein
MAIPDDGHGHGPGGRRHEGAGGPAVHERHVRVSRVRGLPCGDSRGHVGPRLAHRREVPASGERVGGVMMMMMMMMMMVVMTMMMMMMIIMIMIIMIMIMQ